MHRTGYRRVLLRHALPAKTAAAAAALFFLSTNNTSPLAASCFSPVAGLSTATSTQRHLWKNHRVSTTASTHCEAATTTTTTTPSSSSFPSQRTFATWADTYFREHNHQIPPPPQVHAVLTEAAADGLASNNGILVIGDVHGCYDELLELHHKAVHEINGGRDFSYVILVGDLCNKGPASRRVIRHVRTTPNWYTVRGNHDDGALAAALGDERRKAKAAYAWVYHNDDHDDDHDDSGGLTDEDVVWMAQVPYTLRIPAAVLGDTVDTVIVHAGLIPGKKLEEQTTETMVTLREVVRGEEGNDEDGSYRAATGAKDDEKHAWATCWKGPYRVIFGHDARRGLQRTQDDAALGLDTGACYGKELTGVVLSPSVDGCKRTLVSVQAAQVYSPIVRG